MPTILYFFSKIPTFGVLPHLTNAMHQTIDMPNTTKTSRAFIWHMNEPNLMCLLQVNVPTLNPCFYRSTLKLNVIIFIGKNDHWWVMPSTKLWFQPCGTCHTCGTVWHFDLVNGATCVAPGGRGPGIPHKWPLVASRIKTNVIFEFSAVSYIKEQVFRLMQLKGEF